MSDGEVVVRFTSEEDARLFDAFVKVAKMANDSGEKLAKTSAAADRADASLKRFAEHMKDVTATPMEALTRETEKLDRALKANLLTAEEHGRALAAAQDRYQEKLRKSREEQERSKTQDVDASLVRFADRVKELNATPLETLTRETERLDAALKANLLTVDQHGRAVAAAQERYQAELRKTREEQEKANAPEQAPVDASLAKFAERVKELNATPLETLTRETERLDAALKQNLLTVDQHGRAVAAAQERYQAELRKTREEQEKANAPPEATAQEKAKQAALEAHQVRLRQIQQAYSASAISAEQFSASVARSTERLNADLAEVTAETNDADREMRKLAASARELARTPLDRYTERMVQLGALLQQNRIRQDEFRAAAKQAHDQYQAELDQSTAKVQQLGATAESSAGGSGQSFLEMKAGVLAAWGTVGAYVTGVLSKIRQESDEAAQALVSQAGSRGTLAQLANSPEELARLRQMAARVRAMGGAATADEANQFVFAMQSAGAAGEIDTFAQLKNLGILQRPEEMIKYAAAVRKSFGAGKAGSFRDVANQALVAAGSSPENAEQVLKGTARTGVAAAQQGISTDEAMAAVSIMSAATGSGEEAGTRVAAFLRGVSAYEPGRSGPIKYSLRGKSLRELLQDENLAKLSPAELQKITGGAEGAQFYGVARENLAELLSLTEATRRGRTGDLLAQKIAAVQSDPGAMAAARLMAEQGRREVAREGMGVSALEAERQQLRISEAVRTAQRPGFLQTAMTNPAMAAIQSMQTDNRVNGAIASVALTAARTVGGDDILLKIVDRLTQTATAGDQASRQQVDAARSLERAATALERAAGTRQTMDWTRAARVDAGREPE